MGHGEKGGCVILLNVVVWKWIQMTSMKSQHGLLTGISAPITTALHEYLWKVLAVVKWIF